MTSRPRTGAELPIAFDGEELLAVPGEAVIATLVANGKLAQSTDKRGGPRGLYCGMGVCHDCLVTIDGRRSQRACLTKVAAGMRVGRQAAGHVEIGPEVADLAEIPATSDPAESTDVAIVGAGPAGLAAALAVRRSGLGVVIVDERLAPGGQFYKQPATQPWSRFADAQARAGRALITAAQQAGASFRTGTLAWGARRRDDGGIELDLFDGLRATTLRPRFLVIATGAYERPYVVPGWTLPGVMTTGAAQTLLRSYGVAPGRRVLVAGNGPLNLQVAVELLRLGVEVILAEAAPAPWSRPRAALALLGADARLAMKGLTAIGRLRLGNAQLFWRHRLVRVEGRTSAERAVLVPLDSSGKIRSDAPITVEIDAVLTGDGFWPSSELARLLGCRQRDDHPLEIERGDDGATSLPDLFVVGEAGSFGGAQIALAQGELAGQEIARRLKPGGGAPAETSAARRRLARHRRFQSALWRLFAARDVHLSLADDGTTVCRCEAITLGQVRQAIATHEIADLATLKRLTRAGMGRCQGRYCAPRLADLLPTGGFATRPGTLAPQMPLRPMPAAALAREKPEWAGHRRVLLPQGGDDDRSPLPVRTAGTLIIGSGIVGLCTALFLSRAGEPCVVVEQGYPNSGASGGNAGSLHGQLLSFDYGERAEADGGPAARTLSLQADSIRLWQKLQQELAQDLELKITGGVMVAETPAELRFLEAKTEVERAQGIDCEVIGEAELRRIEPALDARFLGAAYCPLEGKINPLVATEAIRAAAVVAGAIVLPGTRVTGIASEAGGFAVETPRGSITAKRIVNAAGSFAGRVAAQLGLDVPVFGAPLQMIVTEAAKPLLNGLVAHAGRHLTLKQAANGNFIIGGGWTASLDPVHGRPRPLRESLEGNLWIAQHVLPALRKLHIIRSWAALNINIDGAPILGEHPAAPCFFNAVTSNGYTLGPLMGRITADLITSGRTDRDITPFAITRFKTRNNGARHDRAS